MLQVKEVWAFCETGMPMEDQRQNIPCFNFSCKTPPALPTKAGLVRFHFLNYLCCQQSFPMQQPLGLS
jgi:hypothetical protein